MLFVKGNPLPLKRVKYDLGNDTHVFLRELSSAELIAHQDNHGDKDHKDMDTVFELLSKCIVDDAGAALFTNAGDVKDHFNIGVSHLQAMQDVILDISGIKVPKN
jgi:hypothetical protein